MYVRVLVRTWCPHMHGHTYVCVCLEGSSCDLHVLSKHNTVSSVGHRQHLLVDTHPSPSLSPSWVPLSTGHGHTLDSRPEGRLGQRRYLPLGATAQG